MEIERKMAYSVLHGPSDSIALVQCRSKGFVQGHVDLVGMTV